MDPQSIQSMVKEIVSRSTTNEGIRRIGIPTKDQPRLLARLFESLLKEAVKLADLTFFIVDQSSDVNTKSNAQTISTYRKNYGLTIYHVTTSIQERIATTLAERTGLQFELVREMLCGSQGEKVNTGAARNFLLLLSAGMPSMQIDDDIELQLYSSASPDDQLLIHSSNPPQTVYPYSDHASVFDGLQRQTLPLTFLLDKTLSILIDKSEHDLKNANRFYQQKLVRPDTVIAMVHPAILGDTPVARNHYLTIVPERNHPMYADSGKKYNELKQSAHVLIKPNGATLTNNSYCITACVLFPTNNQLPPFPPTKRASDSTFGLLLATAYPQYLIAHIPYLLTHTRATEHPLPVFSFQNELVGNHLLGQILMHTPVHQNTQDRIADAGSFLLSIANLSRSEFIETLLSYSRELFKNSIQLLTHKLEKNDWAPHEWQDDIRAFIKYEQELLATDDSRIVSLVDWDALQKRYLTYAQTLFSWDRIWEHCKTQRIEELCVNSGLNNNDD